MPTVVQAVNRVDSANGTSPRAVTITAPASGNSVALTVRLAGSAANVTAVACGNGTSTGPIITRDRTVTGDGVIHLWIVSNITDSPTSVSVSFDGGGSAIARIDMVEFAGSIQQHNAQEGNVNSGSTGAEIGPSLTSAASGVGAFGNFNTFADTTFTPSTSISCVPAAGSNSFDRLIYSANLGAAGAYTIGGAPGTTTSVEATAMLIESVGGGGGNTVVVGSPQRNRRTSGRRM